MAPSDSHNQSASNSSRSGFGGRQRDERGGRGGQKDRGRQGGRGRKRDVGRAEWSRNLGDKGARINENQSSNKRRRIEGEPKDLPVYATKFSAEEIAAEERKPKRKVAVMIGYSGSGYKGMQLNHQEKTIEGDIFSAFVAAGAISKANADDPKKSSLVRCARTDKGVHAAGNVISLKLVIEDPDIVAKINEHLTSQIRVWGISRTNSSFNCYQMVDSRIYEYLIPSYCFLPPHPKSFLGEQIVKLAIEENDLERHQQRQEEVVDFWEETEEKYMKLAIEEIDPEIREEVVDIFYNHGTAKIAPAEEHPEREICQDKAGGVVVESERLYKEQEQPAPRLSPTIDDGIRHLEEPKGLERERKETPSIVTVTEIAPSVVSEDTAPTAEIENQQPRMLTPVEIAVKSLKAAQAAAKRAHRIPKARLERIRSTLSRFLGSHNYHNYTILKTFKDPSAIRVMKSYVVDEEPVIIGGTEWLSLKVHGQSFMMHQIRKMVSAAAMIVRCGCHEGRIQDTYQADRLSIPKAPSLGLLLERPVFDAYNEKLMDFGWDKVDFDRYGEEVKEFKQREIYERIFRDEEKDGIFLSFFGALDTTRSASLLWASSAGVAGTKKIIEKGIAGLGSEAAKIEDVEDEDEEEDRAQEDN